MSAPGVAVLLSWLSCCGSALWRYSSNSPNFQIFSTRSTIKLEYEGTSFSEWSVPESCSIQDKMSPKTELRCSAPGVQAIKPVVTDPMGEEERYLHVESSHICFLWYYTIETIYENLTQIVTLWVYDPENSEPDELEWNTEEPSRYSIVLTKQLATLGQKPIIYTTLKSRIYEPDESLHNGTWTIQMPVSIDDVVKVIKGNRVPFQNCFVADSSFLLTVPLSIQPEISGFLPITLPAGSPVISAWIPCAPSFALVVSDMETFQTNNSFRTWTRVRVPPNSLSDAERHNVSHVNPMMNGILFLINGVVYLKTSQAFTRLQTNEGLPADEILGIASERWCWTKYLLKTKRRKSSLAVWTKNEAYLGYSSLKFVKITTTTELKNLLNLSPTDTLTIEKMEYTGHPLEIAVLLNHCVTCTITKKVYIVIYNEDSTQWMYQDFTLDIPIDSSLLSHSLFSALPALLLWDRHKIYYCYQSFTVTGVLRTTTGQEDLSLLSDGSTIHDIFADYHGNIIVKMENNIMFYFMIHIRDAVKLHSWTSKTIKSIFLISPSSLAYLVYVFDNGTVQPQQYPLNLEVQSVTLKSNDKCPYVAFHNNIYGMFYFLDKRESLKFWVQLVYPENFGLDIIFDYYGTKILEWKKYTRYEIALGYCTKTLIITFSQNVNYEAIDNYFNVQEQNMGLMLFHLRSSEDSKTCPLSQKVFQVAVGCDSNKRIAIKGFNKTGCQYHDFTYVISKSYLRHRPSENLKIRYDWGKYGCPLRLDFREKFQPVIQLFDENGYIKDVKANFIMWEIHGREDYSYNRTMKESGCLHEAQTWRTMVDLNKHLPLEEVWGPENYRHCFSYAVGKPGDLSQPYEIINISNNNRLVWPMDHSGMYVFRVKILDPNYRPSAYMVVAFLFVLIVLFFSVLALSYFHYMRIYRRYIYEPLHKPLSKQKKN